MISFEDFIVSYTAVVFVYITFIYWVTQDVESFDCPMFHSYDGASANDAFWIAMANGAKFTQNAFNTVPWVLHAISKGGYIALSTEEIRLVACQHSQLGSFFLFAWVLAFPVMVFPPRRQPTT